MSGIIELEKLLSHMEPKLMDGEFVFCNVPGELSDYLALRPLASFFEGEGLTLVLKKAAASQANIPFEGTYKQITLSVHSSLDAVGLTAAVSSQLASHGISANVIAAYFHDHIFVPSNKAVAALNALKAMTS